jgi:hypothetical protein
MKIIISILFFTFTTLTYSQEKGSVYLRVFPKNAIIRLNDSLVKSHAKLSLDTGNYKIRLWLPKREYVEKTINIQAGKATHFLEVLSYNDEYKKYKRKKLMYVVNKTLMRYGSPLVLAWFVKSSLSIWSDLDEQTNKHYDAALSKKNDYENATDQSELTALKESYSLQKSAYESSLESYNNSRKNRMIVGSALIFSTVALEYFSFKLKKPEYKEKTLLANVYLNSDQDNLVPSFSLTYKF